MDPQLPYWLLLLASALGGAGLTGLVAVGLKVVDLRHLHDETRRDHYVAMLLSLDNLWQVLVDAVYLRERGGHQTAHPGVLAGQHA